MLDDTLVVWGGEFGRTPMSQGGDGRDHHIKGFSYVLAGGGIKGGITYGATDDLGYAAVGEPGARARLSRDDAAPARHRSQAADGEVPGARRAADGNCVSTWPASPNARRSTQRLAATIVPRQSTKRPAPTSMRRCAACTRASLPGTHTPLAQRAAVLRRAADALDARLPEFCGLLVKEAHKTLGDCVAEVREAVDFCRYYADQAELRLRRAALPGPTGESNELRLHGRGVFVCISPWNFPLAIFAGQVGRGAGRRQRGGGQAGRADAGRRRSASSSCCTRPACRATRWRCCTARARRSAPRWSPIRAPPACASPARRGREGHQPHAGRQGRRRSCR